MSAPRRPAASPRHEPPGDGRHGGTGPWGAAAAVAEPGLASSVWQTMSGFVRGHDPAGELRQALGLGRGSGRVKALMSLADGPLSVAELAQAAGADPPYATIIVNELQALGLLSRTPDARDRRRKTVELTASGRDAVRKAQDIIARPPSGLRDLPAADLVRLREILEQLSCP
jgi:DNA-binding MarR family transcriptional regulator